MAGDLTKKECLFLTGVILQTVIYTLMLAGSYFGLKEDIALIKQDVSVIKTNHLTHLQNALNDIKTRNDIQDKRVIELGEQIARISALLEK